MFNYDQLLPLQLDLRSHQLSLQTAEPTAAKQARAEPQLTTATQQSQLLSSEHLKSPEQCNYPQVLLPAPRNQLKTIEDPQNSTSHNLFKLPPVLPPANSALVRQRAATNPGAAKDSLAAATVTAGASLPLMIGGRSKCVLNLLNESTACEEPSAVEASPAASQPPPAPPAQSPSLATVNVGPKNTALRAEQRKQNMVSVVRPVQQEFTYLLEGRTVGSGAARRKLDDTSPVWSSTTSHSTASSNGSLIDELISVESSRLKGGSGTLSAINRRLAGNNYASDTFDELLFGTQKLSLQSQVGEQLLSEQQARQQMLLFRREELELNKGIRRHHRFLVQKMDERRRSLQIVLSVWAQKDFKHAIEKVVDLYQQGLVFTCTSGPGDLAGGQVVAGKHHHHHHHHQQQPQKGSQLSSLNTWLVADVLSIILLRPKLWNLEICQLLLPIIVDDLLLMQRSRTSPQTLCEQYVEIALKSLKLILRHFGSLIVETLEQSSRSNTNNNTGRLPGVDLCAEERLNRCQCCHKLLLEARSLLAKRPSASNCVGAGTNSPANNNNNNNNKLAPLYREVEQAFRVLDAQPSANFNRVE